MKTSCSFSLTVMILFLISKCSAKLGQKVDVIAEEYNFDNTSPSKGAISHGLASNTGYQIPDENKFNYVSPTLVDKLPNKIEAPENGPLENVDEVATTPEYYDGTQKLNSITVKCTIYLDQQDCFKQSSCGWCGSKGECIHGNNLGPLQECKKSTYRFSDSMNNLRLESINKDLAGMKVSIANISK